MLNGVLKYPWSCLLVPVLSVFYLNDMPDELFTQMFADNTKLYASVKDTEDSRFLQNNINRLEELPNI